MRKIAGMVITVIVVVTLMVLCLVKGIYLTPNQLETFKIVGIIAGCSALYCFIVGQITGNNSQMDKLWSLLPIAYAWIIAARGSYHPRLIIMAVLVTLWGIRLTINFGRKGAYRLKFWEGEEDYRWAILRKKEMFQNKFVWAMFNLFFISIYQNGIVLLMTLPELAVMESRIDFGAVDIVATVLTAGFLIYETIADEQQWRFHCKKRMLLATGTPLEEIEYPYNKGFNTTGLWGHSRHPNYLGEQGFWCAFYLFVIGGKVVHWEVFNWSFIGAGLILLLFLGSSTLGETISSSKYPEYATYQSKTFKYLPWKKYK